MWKHIMRIGAIAGIVGLVYMLVDKSVSLDLSLVSAFWRMVWATVFLLAICSIAVVGITVLAQALGRVGSGSPYSLALKALVLQLGVTIMLFAMGLCIWGMSKALTGHFPLCGFQDATLRFLALVPLNVVIVSNARVNAKTRRRK